MLHKSEITAENIKNLKNFLYLFLVDISDLEFDENYQTYDKREPGYGAPLFQAYLYAFKNIEYKTLSTDDIKKIHSIVLSHRSQEDEGYKNEASFFELFIHHCYDSHDKHRVTNPNYNTTIEGLKEFIRNWMIGVEPGTHIITFDDSLLEFIDNKLLLSKLADNDVVEREIIDLEKNYTSSIALLLQDADCITRLYSMEQCEGNVRDTVARIMDSLLANFNKEIEVAKSDDGRLRAIVKYVQKIDQLHPFIDGNIRTCTVLLNKLLFDFNLPLTLMLNNNRIDCLALDELIQTVKDGQNNLQQLLKLNSTNFRLDTNEYTNRYIDLLPQTLDNIPDDLLNEFIENVLYAKPQQKLEKSPTAAFFKSKDETIQQSASSTPSEIPKKTPGS